MTMRSVTRTVAAVMAVLVLPTSQVAATVPLSELVSRSYLDLADIAPTVSFSSKEVEAFRKELEAQRKVELERLKKEEKQLGDKIKELRDQLKSLNKEASTDTPAAAETRRRVHCEILALEKQQREKRVEREKGMPVAFDNKLAKIDLIQQWPGQKRDIERTIAEGRGRQRTFGDVEDIGVREVSKVKDQEKDIKLGEDALKEMKQYSLMPPELEDKDAKAFVQGMADRIAANSDVKVPVKLTLLQSEEINAFALPGGYLFVNSALIEKTGTETELAGVIAHELAHVSGRHGAKLMRRANIAALMYQVAQIAVLVGTGGAGTIGAYYLMQAGFLGLGLVLDLSLLGVNREFEAEADQLGAQYAWKAGYDPKGFISFFDRMASDKGYLRSASFFRTHPPYFERIVSTLSEITYLPKSADLTVDSSSYQEFKTRLTDSAKKERQKKKDAPSLRKEPDCDGGSEKRSGTGFTAPCAICEASE